MKNVTRSILAFVLTLTCGTLIGIMLQRYFNVSKAAGEALQSTGLFDPAIEPLTVDSAIPDRLHGKLKLYVLVGQSNMVGQAEIPADVATSANIFTLGNDYRWHVAEPPIDDGFEQVDLISLDENAGFGPAFPFAKALIEQNNNQIIGLIPCARSGSSISEWAKSPSDTTLYGSCLKRVRAASPMGVVSGILFFQGEADAIDPDLFPDLTPDAVAWAEKFATFAFNFRADIGNPNVPLVYAQLGSPENLEGLSNWEAVQQQQERLQIPNGRMIVTKDLPMDGIHYTADSYRVIGQRFADAIANPDTLLERPVSPAVEGNNGEGPAAESAQ